MCVLHGGLEISLLLETDFFEDFEVSVDSLIGLQAFLEKLLLTVKGLRYFGCKSFVVVAQSHNT